MIALYEFKRCFHSLRVLEEDDFANIREADFAVKQSFASGGQVSRSLLFCFEVSRSKRPWRDFSTATSSWVTVSLPQENDPMVYRGLGCH
jgi:hypothetical protein